MITSLVNAVIQNQPDAALVMGHDGHVVASNSELEDMFGAGGDAVLAEIAHRSDALCPPCDVHLADGRVFAWTSRNLAIFGDGGDLWRFRDVTAERELARRVHGLEASQRLVRVESVTGIRTGEPFGRLEDHFRLGCEIELLTGIGSFVTDTQTGVTEISDSLREILGMQAPVNRLPDAFSLILPADQKRLARVWQAVCTGASVGAVDARIIRADGAVRDVRGWLRRVVNADPQPPSIIGAVQDVTAWVAALTEARLRLQSEDAFLSLVSHELRNPLGAIMGYANLLEEEIAGPLNAEQLGFVQAIDRAAMRLHRLVDDLLDMAQVQEASFKVNTHPTPYAPIVREVANLIRPKLVARELSLGLVLEAGELVLSLDASRFQQVLTNLVENALKFSPRRGRLTIRSSLSGENLRIEVSDTGPGIALADQTRVFDRFEQAGEPELRQSGGVGLGLAICKAIVTAHGGTIGVHSTLGTGTTFWFEIPLTGGAGLTDPQHGCPNDREGDDVTPHSCS